MKKRWMAALLSAAVLVTTMAGCGRLNNSETVATMKGGEITAGVANFYARYQQAQTETYYASFMGDKMWEGEASQGQTYEESVKASVMEALQRLYVVNAHKDEYSVELTTEENAAIEKAVKAFSEANGEKEKDAVSGDQESVKKVLEMMTVQMKMQELMTKDVDTNVSDEEAAQKSMQYVKFSFSKTDDNGKAVQLTDKEKELLKKEAESFREGAVSAEDFEAYAKEKGYTASKATFDAETTSPSGALAKAADALKEGEVTAVVEDSTGYFVAKVTSLLDREATDKEKETIVNNRKYDAFNKLCEEWKKEADFKVNEKVWAKISFVKQGVVIKSNEKKGSE